MLDGLFLTPAVTAINEALASAKAEGTLVVVGHPKLAKRLGATAEDTTGLDAKSVDAVIGVDVDDAALREWTRVVRDGGAIVTVDKGKPDEASRRALCGGLTEIEQRHAGRSIVTSGLVTHVEETR